MKSAVKHYGPVALLMVAIVAIGVLVTAFTGAVGVPTTEGQRVVVTTSYPLYTAARAVVGDTDGVTVENLIGNVAGCMHDYQLTPANRVTLDTASLVLMGSVETEPFMEGMLDVLSCPVVDTLHNESAQPTAHHGHIHSAEEHTWMQPAMYAAQVEACATWLAQVDEPHAAAYRQNAQAYIEQITAAQAALTATAQALPSRVCITFHDSVKSFAEGLGLTVAASLSVGEDAGISAGDLATVQAVLQRHPEALLLYDNQYTVRYSAIDRLVSAEQVLALDTVVAGDRIGDDWLDAMTGNAALLRQVTEE